MKILADKHIPFIEKALEGLGEALIKHGRDMSPSDFKDIDAYLGRSVRKLGEEELAASTVQFASTASVGTDHVDKDYLESHGIAFASAAGCNAVSVADYVTASLLNLACTRGFSLQGKSIGIVGAGNVGSRVARRCRGLGMDVILNDPPLRRASGDEKYRPIDEILGCDFISFHTPLIRSGVDKTLHYFSNDFASEIRPGAVLINTSRGAVADTEAVLKALDSGRLSDAVIDVWEGEPDIPARLLKKAFIATPHIAGHAIEAKVRAMRMVVNAMCSHFQLSRRVDEKDFLPRPDVEKIKIGRAGSIECRLNQAVKKVYDIEKDDSSLREILSVHKDKRPEFFDRLRRDYPVRREFSTVKSVSAPEDAAALCKAVFPPPER
ncbi:4-phosphoerythronate dehydrogenase [Sedimentisphaera salicampi]|uniref:Erythronate-4-phosphate dehydrogenase n=1 Tax=Sedimentisphaera salicampi TaxID=1941349 RepID=A0A1W6LNQ5_9BACT|nr:4-phosphoerythronate dehydrogenase [Sedimentisphaera salicampi]ARN57409.1 Erythronate-4-phosphate dehydrogenase [Sedimentisphaera salicampi]OXU14556.1 Erythronate-4-phosphate dehydrogenase [Sedimentisphaera salicampi]